MIVRVSNTGGNHADGLEPYRLNGYSLRISITLSLKIFSSIDFLKHSCLRLYRNDHPTPIIYVRDSTAITNQAGKLVLQTFKENPNQPNIFDSFSFMDRREDYIRAQRDNDPEFEEYYELCCQSYQENPDGNYTQQKKSQYNNRRIFKKPADNHYKKSTNKADRKFSHNVSSVHDQARFKQEKAPRKKSDRKDDRPVDLTEQFIVKTEHRHHRKGNGHSKHAEGVWKQNKSNEMSLKSKAFAAAENGKVEKEDGNNVQKKLYP